MPRISHEVTREFAFPSGLPANESSDCLLQSLEVVIGKLIEANVAADRYEAVKCLGFENRISDILMYPNFQKLALRIAECSSTPYFVLERLATHPNSEVRQAVAESKSTPRIALWALARDEDPDVRYILSECHHAGTDIVEALSHDDNPYISARALKTLARIKASVAEVVEAKPRSIELVRKTRRASS